AGRDSAEVVAAVGFDGVDRVRRGDFAHIRRLRSTSVDARRVSEHDNPRHRKRSTHTQRPMRSARPPHRPAPGLLEIVRLPATQTTSPYFVLIDGYVFTVTKISISSTQWRLAGAIPRVNGSASWLSTALSTGSCADAASPVRDMGWKGGANGLGFKR